MIRNIYGLKGGREPPDAMILCYADIEPPRFARQTEPPLCRQCLHYAVNEPPPLQHSFFKILVFMSDENF